MTWFTAWFTSPIYIGDRYYIQLPTEKAHLYHDVDTANLPPLPEQICFAEEQQNEEEDTEELDVLMEDGTPLPSRLHPLVAEKICELVAQGHNEVYTVRKQLRYDSDAFKSPCFHWWKTIYCCFVNTLAGGLWNVTCSNRRKCLRDTICVTFPLSLTSRTISTRLRKLFRWDHWLPQTQKCGFLLENMLDKHKYASFFLY